MAKNQMTPSDASRVQSSQAKAGNDSGKGSFPARAQSSGARNANAGIVPGSAPTTRASGGAKSGSAGGRSSGASGKK